MTAICLMCSTPGKPDAGPCTCPGFCDCTLPVPIPNGECGICRRLILAFTHPAVAPVSSGPEPPGPGDTRGVTGSQSDPPVSHTTGAQPDSPATPPTRT